MTKKEIMQEIFAELHKKRANAIYLAEQNEKRANENLDYKELVARERKLKMQIGLLQFEQKPYLTEQAELVSIAEKKRGVLKTLGLEIAALKPKFECEKCEDTGIVGNSICSCTNQKFYDKLMNLANVNLEGIPYLKD